MFELSLHHHYSSNELEKNIEWKTRTTRCKRRTGRVKEIPFGLPQGKVRI